MKIDKIKSSSKLKGKNFFLDKFDLKLLLVVLWGGVTFPFYNSGHDPHFGLWT